jgi:hypothetical protein
MEMPDIKFTFIEVIEDQGTVIVRPYSSKFKNPPETYPEYNISIASLDPNKDLNLQIGNLLEPTINNIINQEKNNFSTMIKNIKDNINKEIEIDRKKVEDFIEKNNTHTTDKLGVEFL